jgi:hypothetical protein
MSFLERVSPIWHHIGSYSKIPGSSLSKTATLFSDVLGLNRDNGAGRILDFDDIVTIVADFQSAVDKGTPPSDPLPFLQELDPRPQIDFGMELLLNNSILIIQK